MNVIPLRVSVPVCSFRKPYAREYLETERIPPPATVYGFLLALVGEEERLTYQGTRLAIAVTRRPEVSTVLRTAWRIKKKTSGPGLGSNKRPDYQEILTGLELGAWVNEGKLADRLRTTLQHPDQVLRFGGLSLGESRDLVDEVEVDPDWLDRQGTWLVVDAKGRYPLPLWVDHIGSQGTRWQQFSLMDALLTVPPEGDPRWITIEPPHLDQVPRNEPPI